jgi:hypothetical protein
MPEFIVHGPFAVPTVGPSSYKRPDRSSLSDWWSGRDLRGLDREVGCYIFSRRVGAGLLPIYVGKTNASRGFAAECFTDHKYSLLVDGMAGRKGSLQLTLLSYQRHRGPRNHKAILELERYLIAQAVVVNGEGLMNTNGTRDKTPAWSIKGITAPTRGIPRREVREFRRLMGL